MPNSAKGKEKVRSESRGRINKWGSVVGRKWRRRQRRKENERGRACHAKRCRMIDRKATKKLKRD